MGSEGKQCWLSARHMGSARAAAVGPDLRPTPCAQGDTSSEAQARLKVWVWSVGERDPGESGAGPPGS